MSTVDQTIQIQVGLQTPTNGDGQPPPDLTQILILATVLGGILIITGVTLT